ncbi:MAG: type I secretion system permease/ATPase [Rhizobiaceae bacterium]|nr:type I secretion system permease/ATPase [Rhizobiaceae bacterium]MCV0407822.1 type I secretion system permease/ATPase [Rhizobiaceae bacterium]
MATARRGERISLVKAAIRETRAAFSGVALLSGVSNLLMLTGPLFMLQVYDRVLTSRSVPTLVALALLVALLYLFLGVIELIRARVLNRIGQRFEEQLGEVAFHAVLSLPLKTVGSDAAYAPRRDLDHLRQFMSGTGPVAICDIPWLPIYLAVVFMLHPWLGWLGLAGAVVLIVLTLVNEARLRAPLRRLAQMVAARGELVEAARRNAESLRAMGMYGAFAERWRETNEDYLAEQCTSGDMSGGMTAATKVLRLGLQSAILGLGAYLAIFQQITPGAMIAAAIITARALNPIELAIGQWRGFVNARQAKARLEDILERLRRDAEPMELPRPEKSVSVQALTVGSPGARNPFVKEASFRLEAGQGLGIIGPSGSGKSTLARALVGIWPPTRGTIRLDGAEIDQWSPEVLGPAIGYLPQGVELFDATIAENISRLRKGADPGATIAAAKLAGVHDMILQMPDGYDTRIGAAGSILSAGQRQRIGLARALFGNPFLVVLDEPNASLDHEGEVALTQAVAAARRAGSIVILIAHRSQALAAVDQVLVMNEGRQVAFGPRDEILRKMTVRPVTAESA